MDSIRFQFRPLALPEGVTDVDRWSACASRQPDWQAQLQFAAANDEVQDLHLEPDCDRAESILEQNLDDASAAGTVKLPGIYLNGQFLRFGDPNELKNRVNVLLHLP